MKENKISIFQGKQIRKIFYNGQWWFSIIDVIEVLVGGGRPRKYWSDLKKKLLTEGYDQLSEKIGQLKPMNGIIGALKPTLNMRFLRMKS